jgi:hypothetical protein
MADIKISELERVQSLNNGDLVEVSQEDSYSETGYSSKSAKMTDLGEKVVNGIEYTSELNTSNKKIIGAINEIASYTPVYGNTASGAIATFYTSLALPLQDCTIVINGTNLTGANIVRCGINLWDEVVEEGYIKDGGILNPNATSIRSKNFSPCTPNTAYYFYFPEDIIDGVAVCWYDANQTFISRSIHTHNVTSPVNAYYFKLSMYNYKIRVSPTYANNVSLNYPATDTAYHAYNANSTTTAISWNDLGTVSEGTLDVTTGKLTVVNGSMGAGDYQITPIPINQISGTNNIFCDTGNTSVVYACSLKDYIDRQ